MDVPSFPYHDYGKGGRGRDLWQDCLVPDYGSSNVRQMIVDNYVAE